jgi:hypothetical protein
MCKAVVAFYFNTFWCKAKGKATPAQRWTGPEVFRDLRFSDFKKPSHEIFLMLIYVRG